MMKNQYTNKLNKFLSSDKAEQQSALFKKWIKEDSTFADEVALYKKLEAEFTDTGKQKLREELQRLGKKYFNPHDLEIPLPVSMTELDEVEDLLRRKVSWKNRMSRLKHCLMQIAAVGIIFTLAITVLNSFFRKEKGITENGNSKITDATYAAGGINNEEQYRKDKLMESLSYSNNKRRAIPQIKMRTSLQGDHPIVDGEVHLKLVAEIILPETSHTQNIIFKIFNNRKADYIKGLDDKVSLRHGLYYYMIESGEDGDLLYAGDFTVGKSELQAKMQKNRKDR